MSNEPQTVRATRDPAIVGASSQDEARAIAERDWRKHPADTGGKAIAIIKISEFAARPWYQLVVAANVMANGGRPQELTTTEHWVISERLPDSIRGMQWSSKREVVAAVKALPLPYPVLPGIWQGIPNAPLRRI